MHQNQLPSSTSPPESLPLQHLTASNISNEKEKAPASVYFKRHGTSRFGGRPRAFIPTEHLVKLRKEFKRKKQDADKMPYQIILEAAEAHFDTLNDVNVIDSEDEEDD